MPQLEKGQVPFDQLVTVRTAHDVRKLRACAHCEQIGSTDRMVFSHPYGQTNEYYHGRCFVEAHGFEALLDLGPPQIDKLSLGDLGQSLTERIIDALMDARDKANA